MELKALAEAYVQYAVTEKDSPEARIILKLHAEGKLIKTLEELAVKYSGCVSCRYSAPAQLTARSCELGLKPETCRRWEPLVRSWELL